MGAATVSSSVTASTLELEVERQRLRRAQRDVVGRGRSEAGRRHVDAVAPVGEVRDDVDAGVGRDRLRLDVGLEVGRDHGGADEDAASRVGHRAVELRARDLSGRGGGDERRSGGEGRRPRHDTASHSSSRSSSSWSFHGAGWRGVQGSRAAAPAKTTRVMRVVCGRYRMLAGSCQGGSSIQQIGFCSMEWTEYGWATD